MAGFSRISIEQGKQLLDNGASFIDIRDPQSYNFGHISGAAFVDNETLPEFLENADKQQALVVYCYHGNSSQNAAQFFSEQGFLEVMSLDGGFEAWRQHYPGDCETPG